ncbi:MAG: CPBP family intramembrane metalloprotease [Sedimentisphaerales bacterium]|nr:CPBP family intramembrane metalloprotease [Sedimentisphaerales bacterium]
MNEPTTLTNNIQEIILHIGWIGLSLILLTVWLVRTRNGRDAFPDAYPLPIIAGRDILIAAGFFLGVMLISGILIGQAQNNWTRLSLGFATLGLGQLAIGALVVTIFVSRGQWLVLSFRNIYQTLKRAIIYYITAGGVVMLLLLATLWACGIDLDEANKHQVLDLLEKSPPLHTVIIMITGAVLAAPIGEELFFRGLLLPFLIGRLDHISRRYRLNLPSEQSISESEPGAPQRAVPSPASRWAGIILTAIIFAMMHGEKQHWPAITGLGIILGVAYERFGNLLVPILIHFLLNGISVFFLWLTIYLKNFLNQG